MAATVLQQAGLHPSILRRINSIRLFHALRQHPAVSQRELVDLTGVDKSTVSAIISYFHSLGLIERAQDTRKRGPGRPGDALQLVSSAGILAGVHIEPDRLRYVAAGLNGSPIASLDRQMPPDIADVPGAVKAGLLELAEQAGLAFDAFRSIGVVVPGLVTNRGRLAQSPNLRLNDLELHELLATAIGTHVHVGNDSRAAAMAEKLFGLCMDADDFIYIDSASGVGGGLFLGGRLYGGPGGFAGEIGHLKVVPHGRLCTCGGTGCLSAYLAEHALKDRLWQQGCRVRDLKEIGERARAGDGVVLGVLDEAGEMLGIGLADVANLFNPPLVVLGGGLALCFEFMQAGVDRSLGKHALAAPRAQMAIALSSLSTDPVPRGALAVALDGLADPAGEGSFPW
ncbi:transcriptional regulator, MarR family [Faunimonas pinastri]|uniref:Transcriptional regulator, MarR family n=1 Tax=Faunimonas pinastri TaxID=1855383 RepID=A0A1H9DZR3_9HYPH|nr:ROK family transcriptional regulator [Faunimonas pinastri]SEQ18423.1 transcriptional regulator, MarR family [Faunimonas pinastri]